MDKKQRKANQKLQQAQNFAEIYERIRIYL